MAVLTLTTAQKSVCAIPAPGVEGESQWELLPATIYSRSRTSPRMG